MCFHKVMCNWHFMFMGYKKKTSLNISKNLQNVDTLDFLKLSARKSAPPIEILE